MFGERELSLCPSLVCLQLQRHPQQCNYRSGEAPSAGLTEALVELGFETDRLKTGTPARVDRRSVDFKDLVEQPGDEDLRWFSFDPEVVRPWGYFGRD